MKELIFKFLSGMDGLLVTFIVLFATIKIILNPNSRAFKAAVATYFVSVPVGVLAAMIAQEWGVQSVTSIGIGCVFCLTSEKVVKLIMHYNFEDDLKKWVKDRLK